MKDLKGSLGKLQAIHEALVEMAIEVAELHSVYPGLSSRYMVAEAANAVLKDIVTLAGRLQLDVTPDEVPNPDDLPF